MGTETENMFHATREDRNKNNKHLEFMVFISSVNFSSKTKTKTPECVQRSKDSFSSASGKED